MRRYFCTGCTGWIGRSLVAELCKREDTEQIVLLTRNPQHSYSFLALDPRISLYEGDIVSCQFPAISFTDIIHGSNESQAAEPHSNYYTMVEGSYRILDWVYTALADRGGVMPRFLFLSSGAAEQAFTSYGQGKRLCETLLQARSKLGRIARIYTLIGPNTPRQFAAGQFIWQAMNEGHVHVAGGDNTFRTYLHVEDAARWLLAILDRGTPGVPYAVGGDSPWTIRAVAKAVAEAFGVPLEVTERTEPHHAYLPDVRATKKLGLAATISLTQALERIRDHAGFRNPHLEPA